ncbi:MAG: C40 family peptidase [Thermoleophilia bacterium]|nr:C40 family peptidase [Thermoleophilia bacterium]
MASTGSKKLTGMLAVACAALALGAALLLVVKPFAGHGRAAPKQAGSAPLAITFDGSGYYDQSDTPTHPAADLERDPEAKYASPEAAGAEPHRVAGMPAASTTTRPAAGGTTKELRKQLKDEGGGDRATLAPDGTAIPPIGAPDAVLNAITAGNAIRDFPYIWGGGHSSFQDRGYDCSGSVSYALAAAGLVDKPMTSSEFEQWGEADEGKWITVYANAGHVFMIVGGVRFDTSFRDGPRGSRWQDAPRPMRGFTARHWPGL